MHVALVQPAFPIPNKSRLHKSYLPIGLLKLSTYYKSRGDSVELIFGNQEAKTAPSRVCITSLFTYWSRQVWDAVSFYKTLYPTAHVAVGGIYASLLPDDCARSGCDEVHRGVHPEAEKMLPDYSLVDSSFQIVHASRGCDRRCGFCGTHIIEPHYVAKSSVAEEIVKNHVVFYDNNLLANPNIESILRELARLRIEGRRISCECQSGIDGRLLTPDIARLLKEARFKNIRIAWDGGLEEQAEVARQLDMLAYAGFARRDVFVFMLYNWRHDPGILWKKANACFEWGVPIADCRFRPLDAIEDNYNPRKAGQNEDEYFIHEKWSDQKIREFRRLVREGNICMRYNIERKAYRQELESLSRREKAALLKDLGVPDKPRYDPEELKLANSVWLARSRKVTREGDLAPAT